MEFCAVFKLRHAHAWSSLSVNGIGLRSCFATQAERTRRVRNAW